MSSSPPTGPVVGEVRGPDGVLGALTEPTGDGWRARLTDVGAIRRYDPVRTALGPTAEAALANLEQALAQFAGYRRT